MHSGPGAFGEPEVVLDEGVLRAVPAPGHALAAFETAGACGSDAAEIRVGDGLSGFPEIHSDRCRHERVARAHLLGDRGDDPVRVGAARVGDDPEHAPGPFVMRGEFGLPVGDFGPLPVPEERRAGLIEGIGVIQ
ncbi:hypothetical protein JMUB6875_17840 [Nocardia sp. JMUB6875]